MFCAGGGSFRSLALAVFGDPLLVGRQVAQIDFRGLDRRMAEDFL